MTRCQLKPFFSESAGADIFFLLRIPEGAKKCVLFIPAFAEEMNKARRQTTLTSEALVEQGLATLSVDLFGTGDSAGNFQDATWQTWIENVVSSFSVAKKHGLIVEFVVATRLGCSLIAQAVRKHEIQLIRSIFWQPVDNGSRFMTQFLRLRLAASMMGDGKEESLAGLRKTLAEGSSLAVAGYELNSDLWNAIEASKLKSELSGYLGPLKVIEFGRKKDGALSVAMQRFADEALASGIEISAGALGADPFWSATEIVTVELAVNQTVDYVVNGA